MKHTPTHTLHPPLFLKASRPDLAPVAAAYETRIHATIETIDRFAWNRLYAGEIELFDYLHAVEQARIPNFDWFYLTVHRYDRLIAAAPCFVTQYDLGTTLHEGAQRLIRRLRRRFPDALKLQLAAIGSPCTETALMKLAPDLTPQRRRQAAALLVQALNSEARRRGAQLVAVKDLPDDTEAAAAFRTNGFGAVPGMPGAWLNIDFPDIEAYMGRLSAGTRKDMRRKLRAASALRIERRTDIRDVRDAVLDLYRQTRARADRTFEDLTADYFERVLLIEDSRPSCVLYYEGDKLLAANLLLENRDVLLDKFFCMSPEGRSLNLYFVSWFENIRYCLSKGIGTYYSGQAGYRNKTRLGSELSSVRTHFRHVNPLINIALQATAPLLSGDLDD